SYPLAFEGLGRFCMGRGARAILLTLAAAAGAHASPQSTPDSSDLIDSHLIDLWKEQGVSRGRRAEEGEFLRRLCIDLVGEVPTPDEVREYKASEHEEKRRRK